MSVAAASIPIRSMRIIALPLTRLRCPPHLDPAFTPTHVQLEKDDQRMDARVGTMLTHYHFQMHKRTTTGGVVNWVIGKATSLWVGFGKAPEGSWKFRIFQYGEQLMDRIDFEELALKGVDPSLGPSIPLGPPQHKTAGNGKNGSSYPQLTIPLVHPPTTLPAIEALTQFRTLLKYRVPLHRRGFLLWMALTPLTAPLKLIPIIPNLPFFFCAWRSWSHYQAYRASRYLQSLVEAGAIVPEGSEELEKVYAQHGGDDVLVKREGVAEIVSVLGLDVSAGSEMHKAVEQARLRRSRDK